MPDLKMEFPDTARATPQQRRRPASQLLFTLQELVEALDRRIPQVEQVGEGAIRADADRLRACAMQRMALLRRRTSNPDS